MAKPIKETPILKGKDAIRFNENQKLSSNIVLSQPMQDRMAANYSKIKALETTNAPR